METRIPLVGQRLRSAVLMATLSLTLTLTLTLLGTTVSAQPSAESLNESARSSDFEATQLNYERNHWPQAYAAFAALADRGHGDAARIALQMARHGPALYGSSFSASDGQRKRWAALAACAGELAIAECTGPPLRSPAHNFPRALFVRPAFPTASIGTPCI